jgi:hypothetical protein
MAQSSFALLTNLGRAKEAAALANGTAVVITHIAIGDGTTVPSGGESELYNEVARKTISGHGTVAGAANVAYFDIFLEAAEGPFTIREAGLYDSEGDLIAIGWYDPPINKPVPASGQTVEGTIRLEVAFSNIANITIVVDPSMKVALQRLTVLPWIPVISASTVAPPAAPALGDTYVIPTGATGAWAGQANRIAEYTAAGWAIVAPKNGHAVGLPDGRVFSCRDGVYVEMKATDAIKGLVELLTIAEMKLGVDTERAATAQAVWAAIRSPGVPAAGGTANALTVTLAPAVTEYTAGLSCVVRITTNNTGAATLDAGAGPLAIRSAQAPTAALAKDALVAGEYVRFTFNGAIWIAETNAATTANRGMAKRATNGKDPNDYENFLTPGLLNDTPATWFSMDMPTVALPNGAEANVTSFTLRGSSFIDSTVSAANGMITVGAEDAGLWLFDFQLLSNRADVNRAIGYLYLNSATLLGAQQDVSDNSYARRLGVTKIVRLTAGQTVRPRAACFASSGTHELQATSSFSGYRIAG